MNIRRVIVVVTEAMALTIRVVTVVICMVTDG